MLKKLTSPLSRRFKNSQDCVLLLTCGTLVAGGIPPSTSSWREGHGSPDGSTRDCPNQSACLVATQVEIPPVFLCYMSSTLFLFSLHCSAHQITDHKNEIKLHHEAHFELKQTTPLPLGPEVLHDMLCEYDTSTAVGVSMCVLTDVSRFG
jgi:hypothetical protein